MKSIAGYGILALLLAASRAPAEGPLVLNDSNVPPAGVTIRDRTFETHFPATSAVQIAQAAITINTQRPVVIERCTIVSTGWGVRAPSLANFKVVNCKLYGAFSVTGGKLKNHAISATNPVNMQILNNYFAYTRGIEVNGMAGTAGSFKCLRNNVLNIDGRYSRPGGAPDNNTQVPVGLYAGFVQFGNAFKAGTEVAWNQIVNHAADSACEDAVNIYQAGGTPASPLWVHDNYIEGGFPPNYLASSTGSGINCADAGASVQLPAQNPRNILCENNQVLQQSNVGIGLSIGDNITVRRNRVFSTGRLGGNVLPSSFVGIFALRGYGPLTNVHVYENVGSWSRYVNTPLRYDFYFTGFTPNTWSNTSVAPVTAATTDAQLVQEKDFWLQKRANVPIGTDW